MRTAEVHRFTLASSGALAYAQTMTCQEVCEDKDLADLPYKIELNRWGQIIMRHPEIPKPGLCPEFPSRLSWFA